MSKKREIFVQTRLLTFLCIELEENGPSGRFTRLTHYYRAHDILFPKLHRHKGEFFGQMYTHLQTTHSVS